MIYFISNKQHNVNNTETLTCKTELSSLDKDFLFSLEVIGFDLETTSLDPYIGDILLLVLGNEIDQYVIDVNNCDLKYFIDIFRNDKIFLGANCKFDYKFIKTKYNIQINKMFDVMIAEQRLRQGFDTSNSLDSIVERRLKFLPTEMNKNIRMEFVGKNKDNFVFENKHIEYTAGDIKYLFPIRIQQKEQISKFNLGFLIYNIEFPLIKELADCELLGYVIDETKWKTNIIDNERAKFVQEIKLDNEFRNLRKFLPVDEQMFIKNGKWDRGRVKDIKVVQDTLFGDSFDEVEVNKHSKGKAKTKVNNPYINYSSPSELIYILASLKQPVPTADGLYITPNLISKKGKRVVDKTHKFTTGKPAMESYIIENPNSKGQTFIKEFLEYRKYTTRLNTFGETFLIKFKNNVTNRFHTIFRQCHAITGRLQSGDEKNGWFNSQNIPAEKRYRECFITDDDYLIVTSDLSGAEAVIMIDKARDESFYKMAIVNDDAHSPLATAVWRSVFNSRGQELYAKTFEISKTVNKHLRTAFKPMTFGSIYGMHNKKTAKTMNISIEEAKVALKTIKAMIPKTFKMVEANSKFALANGYLLLNSRTNSRIWYPQIFLAKSNNSELDFGTMHEIDGSARNCPIQGTQADMVKEMIVEIGREIKRQNINAQLLGQVHDELIYRFHKSVKQVEFINDNKTKELVTFDIFIKKWMSQVANRYLSFIKMGVEQHIGNSWTK